MVSVQNLTKRFGDFYLNVTFDIPEGRITGLVGKNGAGKSTGFRFIVHITISADYDRQSNILTR